MTKDRQSMKKLTFVLALLLVTAAAHAAIVPDQQQTYVDLGTLGTGFGVGQPGGYQLAQTTKASFEGFLVRVELPMACDGGWLAIDITNVTADDVPGATVYSHTEVDAASFPIVDGYIWRSIDLRSRVRFAAGDRFAIVLTNKSGRCGVGMGSSVDLYSDGRSVWRYEFTPPGIWMATGGLADPIDAAFRTYLEVPNLRESACSAIGFEGHASCECVHDAMRHESRCALLTPEMLLVRRMPFPIRSGAFYIVRWTLVPLVALKGALNVSDSLDQATPLVFIGEQVPLGETLTLETNAFAAATGKLKVTTDVTGIANGRMQTTTEVFPP